MSQSIIRSLAKNVFIPTEESWKRFELEAIVDQYIELFFRRR
jgi:hypothetical protein